ncbi:MAG: heme exporter protein CcmD [Chromatiaceae bacterium]|nr:heme exporter protein CcmD [Chromatiaceae bacterium]
MSEFISQGGYGPYVWGAYGLTLILLVAEVLQLRRQRRTIFARLSRMVRLRTRGDQT